MNIDTLIDALNKLKVDYGNIPVVITRREFPTTYVCVSTVKREHVIQVDNEYIRMPSEPGSRTEVVAVIGV